MTIQNVLGYFSFSVLKVLLLGFVLHLLASVIAFWVPEFGDQRSFAYWAQGAFKQGISKAYSLDGYGYDWLPFYLYLSKFMGAFFEWSGLNSVFGPISRVLLFCLRLPMIFFNVAIGVVVYLVGKRYGLSDRQATLGTLLYVLNPGIILATAVYGYQDALHTFLLVVVYWSLAQYLYWVVPVVSILAFLTKPQAAILLVPMGYFYLRQTRLKGAALGIGLGGVTAVCVLAPFIVFGTLHEVWQMYLDVPRIHQWLTGFAHNFWWLIHPVPPFMSDRIPLVAGFDGLTIGLFALVLLVCVGLWYLHGNFSVQGLGRACAFVYFAFYMVTTELHENHLFAFFAFGAITVMFRVVRLSVFCILSLTFCVNLVTTLLTIHHDTQVLIGPIRVATVNAGINALVFVWWFSDIIYGLISPASLKTEA